MKALLSGRAYEVIKRPFLFLWALLRPSKLPHCPRCDRELGALDERHERVCPRKAKPAGYVAPPSVVAALRAAAEAFGDDDEDETP